MVNRKDIVRSQIFQGSGHPGADEAGHLFVQQQGQQREDDALDEVEGCGSKQNIGVHTVNHRVDGMASVDDGLQRHDF